MTREERFEAAYERAKRMLEIYKNLPLRSGWFGAMMIQKDIDLYERDDRSDALLESMEDIAE